MALQLPIPYGKHSICKDDVDSVVSVLDSSRLTQGEAVSRFESALAEYCHVDHAVALSSGTAALHLACLALDLGEGDSVWTSAMTFSASAMAARYCGAELRFLDICPRTLNIDIEKLEQELGLAKHELRLPKALVVVHFGGLPCDMERIAVLAGTYGFRIIEDACHALGAEYRDQPVGSCQFSDATVFSFHPVKSITAGEGGAVTCRDQRLAKKISKLRHHNILAVRPEESPWAYDIEAPGFNYRMTDIQAALGRSQLRRLDSNVARRREIAEQYRQAFSSLPLSFQESGSMDQSAMHLLLIQVDSQCRQALYLALHQEQILVQVHYPPLYRLSVFASDGLEASDFPATENYYQSCLSLPLYPDLSEEQIAYVIGAVKFLLEQNTRRPGKVA